MLLTCPPGLQMHITNTLFPSFDILFSIWRQTKFSTELFWEESVLSENLIIQSRKKMISYSFHFCISLNLSLFFLTHRMNCSAFILHIKTPHTLLLYSLCVLFSSICLHRWVWALSSSAEYTPTSWFEINHRQVLCLSYTW